MSVGKDTRKRLLKGPENVLPADEWYVDQMNVQLSRLQDSGLSPSSALDLITSLIMESVTADKSKIEKLKMIDKLLNTARALMETSIKHEETATIRGRLESLETRLEKLIKPPARRFRSTSTRQTLQQDTA